jgi:hypothetical protein
MTTTPGEAITTEDHAATQEAWDAIAEGYDRHVAPQELNHPSWTNSGRLRAPDRPRVALASVD